MYIPTTVCVLILLHHLHLLVRGEESPREWSNFRQGIPWPSSRDNADGETGRKAKQWGFPSFSGRQPNIGDNEVGRDFSRFPGPMSGNDRRNWNFGGEDDDAIIFDDDNFNNRRPFDTRRPSTFPRQQPDSPRRGPILFPNLGDETTRGTTSNPTATSTLPVPGMATRRPVCEEACRTTPEYNPVCADDNRTYTNMGRFQCAVRCGKRINIQFTGACPVLARGQS